MRTLGRVLVAIPVVVIVLWGALGLHFAGPRPAGLANALAVIWLIATLGALVFVRPFRRALLVVGVAIALWLVWWGSLTPRNDRAWIADVANAPTGELDGDRLTIHNLRNFDYRSETDFTPRWETRTFDLSKLQGLDLFLSYWAGPSIAHTIMSWDFSDGQHLAISIETRKEEGETYSAVAGFFKQYELYYVVADERDLVRLRTNYRGEDVYLYQLRTPVARARRMLLDYVEKMNELAARPAWYNAATQNCTTTIRTHVQHIGIPMPLDWRLIANGHIDELLYEQGVVDTGVPFAEGRARSRVTERAKAADQDPAFSARIRDGLTRPPLHAAVAPDQP